MQWVILCFWHTCCTYPDRSGAMTTRRLALLLSGDLVRPVPEGLVLLLPGGLVSLVVGDGPADRVGAVGFFAAAAAFCPHGDGAARAEKALRLFDAGVVLRDVWCRNISAPQQSTL